MNANWDDRIAPAGFYIHASLLGLSCTWNIPLSVTVQLDLRATMQQGRYEFTKLPAILYQPSNVKLPLLRQRYQTATNR